MSIPETVRADAVVALQSFIDAHSTNESADLRYTYNIEANGAVLVQQRPSFVNASEWSARPLAKFRYSEARNTWSLYWADVNGRWHRVPNVEGATDIRTLLDVVVRDPVGVFWV